LFNADNVAKYAPAHWHSAGAVIDTSYETLDRMARSPEPVNHRLDARKADAGLPQPAVSARPPAAHWSAPDAASVAGRKVWLVHPWSIGAVPPGGGDWGDSEGVIIGIGFAECHALMPWSERRWRFVTAGLQARTPHLWWGSVEQMANALQGAQSVAWQSDAHIDGALALMQQVLQQVLQTGPLAPAVTAHAPPALFAEVERYCESFSQWWHHTRLIP
jgi:deoxyribodipyrimidine photo-lyase